MIIFKTLRFKNFLSTGDRFTEINFQAAPATLVTGSNGAGKSTMLDALSFALFGKAHRKISKPQLLNSVNQKKCVVEVEFDIGSTSYKIVRGIAPVVFEIHINGGLVDQTSTSRDYQLYLEQNILKLNYKTFHQVVVLGSSSFTPFMQLSSAHRRSVIENLLDISVFTQMNQLLKEDNSIIKDELKDLVSNLGVLDSRESLQASHIEELESMSEEMITAKQDQVEELQQKGEALTARSDVLAEKIELASKDYETYNGEISAKLRAVHAELSGLENEKKSTKKQLNFFIDRDECPTCTQSIEETFKKDKISQLEGSVDSLEEKITGIRESRDENDRLLDELGKVLKAINRDQSKLSGYRSEIRSIATQIKTIQGEITKLQKRSDDIQTARDELHQTRKDLRVLEKRKNRLNDDLTYYSVVSEMLKDSGIKTKIVKQYLPIINKYINEYLHVLDFFVLFEMDENFNETILSRHRDSFSYSSFSEGEKARIDLAILFTWRQVAKMKNSVATNLLILDETFDSSLDTDGIDNLMKILSTLDANTNVFVISHKGHLMAEKFEYGIKFEKVNNFSVMKEN